MNWRLFLSVIILLNISVFNAGVLGVNIEYNGKTRLSGEVLLQLPMSFCVTEDGTFLVVDFKASDVKIYRQNGKYVKLLCPHGYGPNEIAAPFFCHYSNKKFVINDDGKKKIFIYEKKGQFNFVRIEEIYSLDGGYDHCLVDNQLYVSGDKSTKENEPFALYSIKIGRTPNEYEFFLPAQMKFGLKSIEEFRNKYYKGIEIAAIGRKGIFDICGDFAYYCWECDLKIFKINLKTKNISTFGEKMSHYVKPYVSNRLKNAWKTMQGKIVSEERWKMSYVRQIFTTPKHVLVIYNLPSKREEGAKYMLQFYTLNGDCVKELPIPGKVSPSMFFEKQNRILYTICIEDVGDAIDESYYINKYKVED